MNGRDACIEYADLLADRIAEKFFDGHKKRVPVLRNSGLECERFERDILGESLGKKDNVHRDTNTENSPQ